jgi:flagellin-like hook-associated protein FlgL
MALNDISLTAGMRSNLLALQSTTSLLDRTQNRLATGKKVNTALDNPTNFFAAQNHTQRASDLSSRKDGMSEAIQGVQAADKGITGITALIEAAKGLIQSARSSDAAGRANLAGQFNLIRTQITGLAADSSYKGKNFLESASLDVLFNENGGNKLTIVGFDASASGLSILEVGSGTTVAASTVSGASGLAGSATPSTVKTVSTAVFVADVTVGQIITGTISGTVTSGVGLATIEHFAVLDTASGLIAATGVYGGANSIMANGVSGSITLDFSSLSVGASGMSLTGAISISGVFVNGIKMSNADYGLVLANYDAIASGVANTSGVLAGNLLSGVGTAQFGATTTGLSVSFDFVINAHDASGSKTLAANVTVFSLSGVDKMSGVIGAGLVGHISTGTETNINVFVSGTFAATGSYRISGEKIIFSGAAVPPGTSVSYTFSSGMAYGVHSADEITTITAADYTNSGLKVYLSGTLQTAGTDYHLTGTNTIVFNAGKSGAVTFALSGHTTGATVAISMAATDITASSVTTGAVYTGVGILTAASGVETKVSGLTAGTLTGSTTTTAGSLNAVTYKTQFASTQNISGISVYSVTVGSTTLTTGFTVIPSGTPANGFTVKFGSEFASGQAITYKVLNANQSISDGISGTTTLTDTSAYVNGGSTFNFSTTSGITVNNGTFTATETLTSLQSITNVAISGAVLTTGYTVSGNTITFASGYQPTSGQAVTYSITTVSGTIVGGWTTDTGLDTSLNQLDAGLSSLRLQSAALASNLNVVSTRQDFTAGMINVLLKGADNLTLADMNEEGANMLMLQTRQQLSTTSLKMASDAAQAVLRLF